MLSHVSVLYHRLWRHLHYVYTNNTMCEVVIFTVIIYNALICMGAPPSFLPPHPGKSKQFLEYMGGFLCHFLQLLFFFPCVGFFATFLFLWGHFYPCRGGFFCFLGDSTPYENFFGRL